MRSSSKSVIFALPTLLRFSATLLMLLSVLARNVHSFSLTTTSLTVPTRRIYSRTITTTSLAASKAATFTTVLDGPCWESLQDFLYRSSSSSSSSSSFSSRPKAGILTVMTGTLKSNDGGKTRVVGIPSSSTASSNEGDDESTSSSSFVLLESGEYLLADSVARIPNSSSSSKVISDSAAATTFAHAVTHVHALCTVVENVGTASSSSNFLNIPKKVVVLGGHDDAINAAKAMSVLGSDVTIVSTKKDLNVVGSSGSGNKKMTKKKIETLTPSSTGGELELGFSDVIGTFDALLDTIGNEQKASSVVRLLQQRHACNTYVSTCSGAEQVIAREGLLFGPNKAKEHMQQQVSIAAASDSNSKNRDAIAIIKAVPKIGSTVETLLEAGFVWGSGGGGNSNSGGIGGLLNNMNAKSTTTASSEPQARGWSMAAAWEATTWPRDTTGNVRFGLPVVQGRLSVDEDDDDDDDDDEESGGRMISKPPLTARRQQLDEEELDEEAQNDDPLDLPVMQVSGMKGLNRQILARDDQNVVLFLSAPFCRTCRKLTTPYTRMARANKREEKKQTPKVPLVFAKADASGLEGKTLGRALSVEAVPAFVLFKNGKRYGSTLSVSKIPSEQLDLALQYLRDGRPWDNDAFRPQNTGRQTSLKER